MTFIPAMPNEGSKATAASTGRRLLCNAQARILVWKTAAKIAKPAYFFGAQGFLTFIAEGAQGFDAFLAFGAQGFLVLLALGAQGFVFCAEAGNGVAATRPPIAAIDPRVCRDFLSMDISVYLFDVRSSGFAIALLRSTARPSRRSLA